MLQAAFFGTTDPVFASITGRDGLEYGVWKNPTSTVFLELVRRAPHGHEGMRGIVTADGDVYFWQSTSVLHRDFVASLGIDRNFQSAQTRSFRAGIADDQATV